jgi:septum formation protein
MQPIDDAAIERYLDSEAWLGKAGAFGFQDGPAWIQLLEGSPTNVVGLPMEFLASTLANFPTPHFPASNALGGGR